MFNIKIYKKVYPPYYNSDNQRVLLIELGKWWSISITRELAENIWNAPAQHINLFKNKWFIRKIKEGEIIPLWYGYAYYSFDCDIGIYMLVPLNFLAAGLIWLKHKWFGFKQIPRGWNSTQEAYRRGYQSGYEEGFNEASSK